MRRAREENDQVVVSIFVNPTQFGPTEDFTRYPRNLERDAEMAESVGVDLVFAPEVDEIYPRAVATTVRVPEVTETYEGAHRPGHFDGVATVVCKLFNIVQPTVAYFGLKDLQQCQVVRRMVQDLDMPVRLSLEPTVRESDGLAMSSRNVYLSPEERAVAPLINTELRRCREAFQDNSLSPEQIAAHLDLSRSRLAEANFITDYLDLISLETMSPIDNLHGERAIVFAAKLGRTRLIDNVVV